MDRIILMNVEHKQVGQLTLDQDGTLEISVSSQFASLGEALRRLGETISKTDIYRRRSVREGNRISLFREKLEKSQDGYIKAVADFINNERDLVKPRVFAVVRSEQ